MAYGRRMATTPSAPRGSYAKSADTRRAILDAAIAAFAESGLDGASTRAIAAVAGVNQPALNYHFGSKQGLYRACAEAIIERFADFMAEATGPAVGFLAQGKGDPAQARKLLGQVMDGLVDTLVAGEDSPVWAGFVAREMNAPGEAFAIFYERLWQPGTELAAQLIHAGRGGEGDLEASRLDALMLISNMVAFTSGRRVTKAIMGWQAIGPEQLAAVRRSLDRQLDALVADTSGDD